MVKTDKFESLYDHVTATKPKFLKKGFCETMIRLLAEISGFMAILLLWFVSNNIIT